MIDIIERQEWGHKLPLKTRMILPATKTWLHHTVTKPSSSPIVDMQIIQEIGRQRFGIFPYSYVVHPSGFVLEGAGLTLGAHTADHNSTSFGIAWIGNFELDFANEDLIQSTTELIVKLIKEGQLTWGIHPTGGHRDTKATACPGSNAYAVIPTIRERVNDVLQKPTMSKEVDIHMNIIFRNHSNRQAIWLIGNKLIQITGEPNVAEAEIGGTQVAWIDDDEYKAIIKAYGPVFTAT